MCSSFLRRAIAAIIPKRIATVSDSQWAHHVRPAVRAQCPSWAIESSATVTAKISTSFWPGSISTP